MSTDTVSRRAVLSAAAGGIAAMAGCGSGPSYFEDDEITVRKRPMCREGCWASYETARFPYEDGEMEVGVAGFEDGSARLFLDYDVSDDRGEQVRTPPTEFRDVIEEEEMPYQVEGVPRPFTVDIEDEGVKWRVETGSVTLQFDEPVRWEPEVYRYRYL